MRRLLLPLLLVLLSGLAPAHAQAWCNYNAGGSASPPAAVAADLLRELAALDAAVPSPSPAEQQWLEEELASGDSGRVQRVVGTPEYTLRTARAHVTLLVSSLRQASTESDRDRALRAWMVFLDGLVDTSGAEALRSLISTRILRIGALPLRWRLYSRPGDGAPEIYAEMVAGRNSMVSSILRCTLPILTGVPFFTP